MLPVAELTRVPTPSNRDVTPPCPSRTTQDLPFQYFNDFIQYDLRTKEKSKRWMASPAMYAASNSSNCANEFFF